MAGNWNSGRRPQPTKLKLLRGNPGKRRLAPEPQPPALEAAFDEPPPELADDALAQAEWRRVAPLLRACGMVTEAERTALVALCQQWSRYLEAQAQVRRLGMVVQQQGVPMTNPFLPIVDKALGHCQRLWTELGLTPTGRARYSQRASSGRSMPAAVGGTKWPGL